MQLSRRAVAGIVAAVVVGFVAAGVGAAVIGADDREDPAADAPTAGSTTSAPPDPPPDPPEDPGPPELLPNLRSLGASDLQVHQLPDGRSLRFAASLANLGPGPLVLRPQPPGARCPRGRHPAVQVVYRDAGADGRYRLARDRPLRSRHAGCMLEHGGHDHWHFDAMASYTLREVASREVVAASRKVSFCLRDNRRVERVSTTVRKEYFGECSRTRRQGISPGWVDVYSADLPGQSLRLPSGDGPQRFCLELAADPRGRVEETDEADNAVATGIVVAGLTVERLPALDC